MSSKPIEGLEEEAKVAGVSTLPGGGDTRLRTPGGGDTRMQQLPDGGGDTRMNDENQTTD